MRLWTWAASLLFVFSGLAGLGQTNTALRLRVETLPAGRIALVWPEVPTGFSLETTRALVTPPLWEAVPGAGSGSRLELQPEAMTQFFRLRQLAATPRISGVLTPEGLIRLTWNDGSKPYQLEQRPSLGETAVWGSVTGAPVLNGGIWSLSIPAGMDTAFFRLREIAETAGTFRIVEHFPADGAREIGVTYRPKVVFSQPVSALSLTATNFQLRVAGRPVAARIVPANDGSFAWLFPETPLPGGGRIEVELDGATIRSRAGVALDADDDGVPGGRRTIVYTTVNRLSLTDTALSGVVVDPGPDGKPRTPDDVAAGPDGILGTDDDAYRFPLAGVRVFLLGREDRVVRTGLDGRFRFDEVPSGNIKVVIDGQTAVQPPAGMYFPEMVMDASTLPGTENTVMPGQPAVYLPRLSRNILSAVDARTSATIRTQPEGATGLSEAQRQQLLLEVPANSLIGENGQSLTHATIGISTVPPELVRDMLPAGLLQHTFDITVQAPGIAVFSQPAPMTFPNTFNAAPGTQLNFLSFDHTTGRLVIEGTATVSADGQTVRTDPGTGITHPGWHGLTPPGSKTKSPCKPGEDAPPLPRITPEFKDILFTKDGESAVWTLNVAEGAAAKKSTCPAYPVRVEIKVLGPGSEFLEGLTDQNFLVQIGDKVVLPFSARALVPMLKTIDVDRLYGVTVELKVSDIKSGAVLLFQRNYIYRLLDAADDEHEDGTLGFADTARGVTRERTLEPHLGAGSEPTWQLKGESDYRATAGSLVFEPRDGRGDLLATASLVTPNGEVPGFFFLKGKAKVQRWNVDVTQLAEALRTASLDPSVSNRWQAAMSQPGTRLQYASDTLAFADTLLAEFGSSIERVAGPTGDSISFSPKPSPLSTNTVFTAARVQLIDNKSNGGIEALVANRANYSKAEQNYRLSRCLNQVPGDAAEYFPLNWLRVRLSTNMLRFRNTFGSTLAHEIGHAAGMFHTRTAAGSLADSRADLDLMSYSTNTVNGTLRWVVTKPAMQVALGTQWTLADGQKSIDYYGDFFTSGGNFQTIAPSRAPGTSLADDSSALSLCETCARRASASRAIPAAGVLDEGGERNDDLAGRPLAGAVPWVITSEAREFISGRLEFHDVILGGGFPQKTERNLILRNLGDTAVVISGADMVDATNGFSVAGLPSGTRIEPGAERVFSLVWNAQSPGTVSVRFRLRSNATAGDYEFIVSGTARTSGPRLEVLSPNNNLAGAILAGAPVTNGGVFTLTNSGGRAVRILGVQLTNRGNATEFAWDLSTVLPTRDAPWVLEPGTARTLGVRFQPAARGLRAALVSVESDDPNRPNWRGSVVGTGLGANATVDYGNDFVACEVPGAADRTVLREKSDSNGNWSFFIPGSQHYHAAIWDPRTAMIGHSYGFSAESGRETLVRMPGFSASRAPDRDGDGVPDDIEFAVGTNPDLVDTDGDGVSDFEALRFAGRSRSTGVIARIGVPGSAYAVAVEENLCVVVYQLDGQKSTLALYDVSDEEFPSLLQEISVDQTIYAVHLTGQRLVAEAADEVLLFNVADPLRPRLERTSQVAENAPVINLTQLAGGFVVAAGDNEIATVDLETGAVVDRLNVPSFTPIGMVPTASHVYVLSEGNFQRQDEGKLFTFKLESGRLELIGSTPVLDPRRLEPYPESAALFGGSGKLHLLHTFGVQTFDLADPAIPRLSDDRDWLPATNCTGFACPSWTAGILASPDLLVLGRTDDPANTNRSVLGWGVNVVANWSTNLGPAPAVVRIPNAGAPTRGLAVSRGIAYSAEAEDGVRLIRLQGVDLGGAVPVVRLLPLNLPPEGWQPGQPVTLLAEATDDGSVQRVEWYADGISLGQDSSYPYILNVVPPSPQSPGAPVLVQARAVDSGGNEAWSNELRLEGRTVPFRVMTNAPVDGRTYGPGVFRSFWVQFSAPAEVSSLTAASFRMVSAGPDGAFSTADDVVIPARLQYGAASRRAELELEAPLAVGRYQIQLAPSVRGLAGDSLPSGSTWTFRVLRFDVTAGGGFQLTNEINLEGAQDRFGLRIRAGQSLFLNVTLGPFELTELRAFDADGAEVQFGVPAGFFRTGAAWTFEDAGEYVVEIGSPFARPIGGYTIEVTERPAADDFSLPLGVEIGAGSPGPGAGVIERHGGADRYRFTVVAGQTLRFSTVSADESIKFLSVNIEGPGRVRPVIDNLLEGFDKEVTFETPGEYVLQIGGTDAIGVGGYRFFVRSP